MTGCNIIGSLFFVKFFGLFLAISIMAGAGILLFYISGLEKEIETEKGKETDRSGEK